MSEWHILQNKAAKILLGHPPWGSEAPPVWLGKLILTSSVSKIKLSIHITQDVLMIFVYPFLKLTGVNKLLSIKLQKTWTVFQLIWKKHISYLFWNPSWKIL